MENKIRSSFYAAVVLFLKQLSAFWGLSISRFYNAYWNPLTTEPNASTNLMTESSNVNLFNTNFLADAQKLCITVWSYKLNFNFTGMQASEWKSALRANVLPTKDRQEF